MKKYDYIGADAINRAFGVQVGTKPQPKRRDLLSHFRYADTDDLHVRITSDGTLTEATIHVIDSYSGEPDLATHLARGVAKRRKGETRSKTLGVSLAVARAFLMLGEEYMRLSEKELGE